MLVSVAVVAGGGVAGSAPAPVPTPAPTPEPTPSPTPAPTLSLQQRKEAGETAATLKGLGFTAAELKALGGSLLTAVGFAAAEIQLAATTMCDDEYSRSGLGTSQSI